MAHTVSAKNATVTIMINGERLSRIAPFGWRSENPRRRTRKSALPMRKPCECCKDLA